MCVVTPRRLLCLPHHRRPSGQYEMSGRAGGEGRGETGETAHSLAHVIRTTEVWGRPGCKQARAHTQAHAGMHAQFLQVLSEYVKQFDFFLSFFLRVCYREQRARLIQQQYGSVFRRAKKTNKTKHAGNTAFTSCILWHQLRSATRENGNGPVNLSGDSRNSMASVNL